MTGGPRGFAKALLRWFAKEKRPMPWRLAPAPYTCWLSEIMLQQTVYATALPYFERFLRRFPTVEALAAADQPEVLKAWEGLGYYARARNLHAAARRIVAAGWPHGAAQWAAMPGVGPYTAAALASVLDGEPAPVVDGNVARVFARYWELDEDFRKLPARQRLARRLQPEIEASGHPGDFNQAMMELGALVCVPQNPSCGTCPLRRTCQAGRKGTQARFPVRPARKRLPVRKATVVVLGDGEGRVLLVENREGGLLRGLWELPTVEAADGCAQTFSHFRLELSAFRAARTDARFVDPGAVPLATATRKVLVRCGWLSAR
ncbi:MAG: A/G-specific adenine glycosylase [Kiritimatiellia bacterium]